MLIDRGGCRASAAKVIHDLGLRVQILQFRRYRVTQSLRTFVLFCV